MDNEMKTSECKLHLNKRFPIATQNISATEQIL